MSERNPPTPPEPQGAMDRLANLALLVAAAALAGLVLVQGWQVFARYVINDSPSWAEPATVLLLSTAMSLAAAAGVHMQRHFSFTLLSDGVGPGPRKAMAIASQLVIMLIGTFLSVGAMRLWLDGLDVRMAGAPLSQGSAFLPLSVGGALMVAFGLHRLVCVLRAPRDGGG